MRQMGEDAIKHEEKRIKEEQGKESSNFWDTHWDYLPKEIVEFPSCKDFKYS